MQADAETRMTVEGWRISAELLFPHGRRGWLAKDDGSMMVVSNTLLRNQSTSQKGQSLPFPLLAGRSNGCFYMVRQPWFLVSGLTLPMLCTIAYLIRCKERGTIRFTPELVHNLVSALALRAPSSMVRWHNMSCILLNLIKLLYSFTRT